MPQTTNRWKNESVGWDFLIYGIELFVKLSSNHIIMM